MSDISGFGSAIDALSSTNKYKKDEKAPNELGQDAFLQLMISQLKNQDPLSPQDNGEFVSQLAQFSSVEGLDKLNNNFDSFANKFVSNQALQASSLVGRTVTVPGKTTALEKDGIVTTSAEVPAGASNFSLAIYKNNGALAQTIEFDKVAGDEVKLAWNGREAVLNDQAVKIPESVKASDPGIYTFKLSALVDGKRTELDNNITANVNSVTLGKNGTLTLNLAGAGSVNLSDIKEINE
ncbi:MAG TPA: flagellar hook assembly protein FlgD [Cellvibrionaceae bacterium]